MVLQERSTFALAEWLRQLDAPDQSIGLAPPHELMLGGTGHLLLEIAEEEAVVARLREEVLPALAAQFRERPVCVLTGLAPGADLLFTRVVSSWLLEAEIPYRLVGLLPLPQEWLLEDWTLAAETAGAVLHPTDVRHQADRLTETIRSCSAVIDLMPPGTTPNGLRSPAFRQRQYRQLAACLAERSDILVAMLRRANPLRPGGTAEVVDWRRHPQRVPAEFSTLPAVAEDTSQADALRPLIVIDPQQVVAPEIIQTAAGDVEPYAERAAEAMRTGNYLQCYEVAQQAAALGLESPRLLYLSLLALANAGSTALAWRKYRELGLTGDEREEDWLALKGRLLKDLARSAGSAPGNAPAFLRAAQAYLAAYRLTGGSFTAINAATMFQLGGDSAQARQLATETLELLAIANESGDDESARYYHSVTEAEAALLLGDVARSRICLKRADGLLIGNLNARSRTRGQLKLLADTLCSDCGLAELLQLPDVIRIRRRQDACTLPPMLNQDYGSALVYLAVQRGADLDIAESLLQHGAQLHLVLPEDRVAVVERWRLSFGAVEAQRLEQLLDQGENITVARGFMAGESTWAAGYVEAVTDGLAALDAARLGCTVNEVWLDGDAPESPSAEPPSEADQTQQRRFAGLIFADIVGFSRLQDSELPRFWEVVMGGLAQVVSGFGTRILSRQTWGDALHVVTADAVTAADLAIQIQALFERLRRTESGNLGSIELRLAVHYAPVFCGLDPVSGLMNYYGSQLAFTARIEPVTPPGMIFVSELLAARLMLDAPRRFRLEYAGQVELAKRYGRYRLFNLHAAVGAI